MKEASNMVIATWNVNSIRTRLERLTAWLERTQPDVVCLQELKVTDDQFPHDVLTPLGYQAAIHGQPTYNGVAILSRLPLTNVTTGLGDDVDDPQARLIAADVGGVHVISAYFPNGSEVGSEKYAYKLAWMARLRDHLARQCDPGQPLALCGDYNVAPDDTDVARPAEWADSVLCHPDVRTALNDIAAWGLVDTFRAQHPEGGIYSWWDYRQLGFQKGNGLRIDHVFATPSLAATCREAVIDRDERKGDKPSDHAPVRVTFDLPGA
jgi:exodeoxyribonuclease-3